MAAISPAKIVARIDFRLAVIYWLEQFAGACAAALLLWWIFPGVIVSGSKLGAPQLLHQGTASVGYAQGFALEAVMTFFLMLAVFATAVDSRGAFKAVAGFGIGLVITIDILCGGPLTGAAMNPSRAFGPELVHRVWDGYTWIYYAGPAVGAIIAAVLYELMFLREPPSLVGSAESGIDEPRPGDLASS